MPVLAFGQRSNGLSATNRTYFNRPVRHSVLKFRKVKGENQAPLTYGDLLRALSDYLGTLPLHPKLGRKVVAYPQFYEFSDRMSDGRSNRDRAIRHALVQLRKDGYITYREPNPINRMRLLEYVVGLAPRGVEQKDYFYSRYPVLAIREPGQQVIDEFNSAPPFNPYKFD